MEYWEFLIQREGDRGWRTIETGNLQLKEGKYRIVANSNLLDTQVQTRVTHQTTNTPPKRRSQSRTQTTSPRGLLAILPFTDLQSGIWQFVCSSTTATNPWQRILKLRVLPLIPSPDPVNLVVEPSSHLTPQELIPPPVVPHHHNRISTQTASSIEECFDLPVPTAPIVPISMIGKQENYADGLDRLLEQLERESLAPQPQPPTVKDPIPGKIQLKAIFDAPPDLISLTRSTFAGLLPGNRLTISGTCNLLRSDPKLIKAVKSEKLSICLRDTQTSAIIMSIEQSLPPNLDTFTFSGDLELPTAAQISFLTGEVSLYDKHNIQLASRGFTVTLSLNSLHESDLSLFQAAQERDSTAELLAELTAELQLETITIGSLNSAQASTNMSSQNRAAIFTHPDVIPVDSSTSRQLAQIQSPNLDITGDLEIDFNLTSFDRHETHSYDNLEVVIDD